MIKHFIDYGMAEGRQGSAYFNVWIYQQYNPDLVAVFGSDLLIIIIIIMNGKNEGRIATASTPKDEYNYLDYIAVLDIQYYKIINPDIVAALGGDDAMMLAHFVDYGMAEGRQGSPNFNVWVYIAENPDLSSAFGNDLVGYYKHYINFGQFEGRPAI